MRPSPPPSPTATVTGQILSLLWRNRAATSAQLHRLASAPAQVPERLEMLHAQQLIVHCDLAEGRAWHLTCDGWHLVAAWPEHAGMRPGTPIVDEASAALHAAHAITVLRAGIALAGPDGVAEPPGRWTPHVVHRLPGAQEVAVDAVLRRPDGREVCVDLLPAPGRDPARLLSGYGSLSAARRGVDSMRFLVVVARPGERLGRPRRGGVESGGRHGIVQVVALEELERAAEGRLRNRPPTAGPRAQRPAPK